MHTATRTPSRTSAPWLLAAALAVLVVGMRLATVAWPGSLPWNFTPVLAVALYAGAHLGNRWLALATPLAAMFVADLVLGFSLLTPVVYGCLTVLVLAGAGLLRGRGLLASLLLAVGGATGFYVITNFAVWLLSGMYPANGSGLLACYVAAIPFYLYGTLPGTVLWAAVLFARHARRARRPRARPAAPQHA